MNIEEAKEKIKEISYGTGIFLTNYEVNSKKVLEILDQLDKPKPEVPQFVADWIEECEEEGLTLKGLFSNSDMPAKIFDWIFGSDENCRLMAEAWINGYTVEKEKLYTVDLPNGQPLVRGINTLYFSQNLATENVKLTESEIRKDFEWAWQFAEEVTG
ncbi:TPA: DUF1642 domain-containing protein [Streptococcus pyogenes]|uniref:DUF1642 domain-containing protein n=1 Tax=Streptococcus pyogenes TaxID=1314 RepID=UPI00109B8155|nr:DUF1642 domain-containing protein [Streptococcus pyogenes]QBX28808.1 hypothetical protein Javan470_0026 [Streptococcus phage Javan470]QCK31846.1 DUF1642 domain-containing protein [Streptococcus pyogenes]VGQ95660.1 phage protein [Streptococcus pyogenes]VGR09121.1 phage protein [Streptococcus pyogenes]VGR10041.1 phage protein [Streptococcus pyogenes]